MDKIYFLIHYLRFLFISGNAHSIHSPFIFDFYTKVVEPKKQFYIFKKIERLRRDLLKSKEIISITDLGAGSKVSSKTQRKVSSIARHAMKSPQIGQFLFKTVLYFRSKFIVELGTSFGITTCYLAKADSRNRIFTFEGCPRIAEIGKANFEKIKATNIRSIPGNIDQTLSTNLAYFNRADLIFFDANHRYESTLNYFNNCLSISHEESVFIFDDIHWSSEMRKAWKEVINHPSVTLSIDFFFLGMVFFRKAQPKQHFTLRL